MADRSWHATCCRFSTTRLRAGGDGAHRVDLPPVAAVLPARPAGPDWALPLVAGLLGPDRRWTLVLDRTQWAIGKREVNYLVLAVVTRHFRVPILWTLLPRGGNSGTAARIALIERYLAHFPVSSVAILLADREFIGARWLNFLDDLQIPFAIRLREDLRVITEDGCELTLRARLRGTRRTRSPRPALGNVLNLGPSLDLSFEGAIPAPTQGAADTDAAGTGVRPAASRGA
jgi:hypothetical protein